ncbi:hypothetical protein C8R46DRAFT_1103536 [Mycena filopes]|nr:hypothetical protein C8R46DRAFT_1103536 [Mycena filopes]
MEKKRMTTPSGSSPIRRSRLIVAVVALIAFLYFFGSPFRLPAALKDVSGISRANIVQLVKPKSKVPAKVDEIFGLLNLVTGDSEHEHILGHTEGFDPTKPVDMALYAAGADELDWNKRVQELNERYPLVVFSKMPKRHRIAAERLRSAAFGTLKLIPNGCPDFYSINQDCGTATYKLLKLALACSLASNMVLDSDSDSAATDELPPYQRSPFQDRVAVRGDGRIDVDLDSKLGKALATFVPEPPPYIPHPDFPEPPREWRIKLNIVLQVVGSRGDVQPFIALGTELQKHGHRVRLATHDVFADFVTRSGLEFYPIGGDPGELMAYMVNNPGLIPSMKSLREGNIQRKRAMVLDMLDGCWRSCVEPDPVSHVPFVADAIIANPPSFAHVHCAQALGIPVHLVFTMPWTSTRAFPNPLANVKSANTDAGIANYISYSVVEFFIWQALGDVINRWRYSLDLEPVPLPEGPGLIETLRLPMTYCFSPLLVPRPADWASHIDVCGFFFRDPPDYTPPDDLDAFLRAGPPPIYIGFGSVVVDDGPRMSTIILQAVQVTRVRAIISRGWSNLDGPSTPNVFYLGDCPHEWLFQHVSAVVHHGGAGPTTIIPFFGDQPFWGRMVAASGAGPEPVHHKDLDVRRLADAIAFCLTPHAAAAASELARKMKSESGVKAAVASFHAQLPFERLECDILDDYPAVWKVNKGKKKMRLSKQAAEVLMRSSRLGGSALKFHETKRIRIENRRWDPITGISSAILGLTSDVLDATTGIVVKPIQALRQSRPPSSPPHSNPSDAPAFSTSFPPEKADDRGEGSSRGAGAIAAARDYASTAGAMTAASGKSLGAVFATTARGVMVDIPLAVTHGMRSLPRLYGEDVRDYGEVRDWKSGLVVAGKTSALRPRRVLLTFSFSLAGGRRMEAPSGWRRVWGRARLGSSPRPMWLVSVGPVAMFWLRLNVRSS